MVKAYSCDMRNLAVRKYHQLHSCRRVADIMEVGKTTINNWVKKHPTTRSPPWKKVTAAVRDIIKTCIELDPCVTMASITEEIHAALGVLLSEECVRLTRVSQNLTRKKVGRVVSKEGLHEKRKQFEMERAQHSPDAAASIDEASFWFSMKPGYGYCQKGKRLEMNDHYKKNYRWTLLLAVCNERILSWKLYDTSCTGNTFAEFIKGMDTGGRSVLLMDNASIHRARVVQDACRAANITPWYLPPYSPEYQPVEHVFSVIKNCYRRQPTPQEPTMALVTGRVEHGLARVSESTLRHTFDHCWAYEYQELPV